MVGCLKQEEIQADTESDDEDQQIYNPLKLPMGWDGKPIPYWLYKLHGLGQVYIYTAHGPVVDINAQLKILIQFIRSFSCSLNYFVVLQPVYDAVICYMLLAVSLSFVKLDIIKGQ